MSIKFTLFPLALSLISIVSYAQTSTVFSGNWNDPNNWSNGIPNPNATAIIQHHMIATNNITINNGSYFIMESGSLTDPSGGGNHRIQVGNNGLFDVDGNVSFDGNLQTGYIRVREYDTLIVGNAEFRASSNITIDQFGVLIVNGNLDINAAFFQATTINCNGIIYVNGDINANSGFLGSVDISGTGIVQATGSVSGNGIPAPSFFGSTNIGCNSNCEFGGGAGLPIELVSFDAKRTSEGSVKLEWITETELNNDFFIVEKSYDGYIFEKIAKVPGAGTSLNRKHYEITTSSDIKDVYFLLTQVNFDGSSRTFAPIALEASQIFENSNSLVYPNPVRVNGFLNVYFNNSTSDSYVEIRDINGKLLLEEKLNSKLNQIHLDGSFKNGIYILTIINSKEMFTTKLIIAE